MKKYNNTKSDFPLPLIEGRPFSIDVDIRLENSNKAITGYFNYNTMLWYSFEGNEITETFKWEYKN